MEAVILFPAIDLKDGQCVRLEQGDMARATVFNLDPAAQARAFAAQGFEYLHVVDLDGAFAGKPMNAQAVESMLRAVTMPVQLGGGIRDLDTIDKYLDMGLQYVIIGTAAVKTPGFLRDACDAFPDRVIVGLDAKDGMVAIDGWAKVTNHNVIDLARRFEDYGVVSVIYTDIGRDGMMNGVNIEATVKLAQALRVPVIASGGLTDLEDVRRLAAVENEGIEGAITGRAIYEGSLQFASAQALADELAG